MKITFLQGDSPGIETSSRWLCHWPAQELQRRGHTAWVLHGVLPVYHPCPETTEADFIVVESPLFDDPWGCAIRAWKKQGKAVAAIFDDAYHVIPNPQPPWNQEGLRLDEDALKRYSEGFERFVDTVKQCDFAVVPTKKLAKFWAGLGVTCYIVPNRLPPGMIEPKWDKFAAAETPTIGWGGSVKHGYVFANTGAVEALAEVSASGEASVHIVGIEEIAEMITAAGGYVRFTEFVPYREWVRLISGWSIGIAPLWGEYDSFRSWIKVLEYSSAGLPWIASKAPPYEGCKGGIFVRAHAPDKWLSAFHRLLHRPALMEKLSAEGIAWAQAQTIDKHDEWEFVLNIAKQITEERKKT